MYWLGLYIVKNGHGGTLIKIKNIGEIGFVIQTKV